MADEDPRYEIEDPEMKALLREVGAKVGRVLPPGWGFTLFLFTFEEPKAMFWMSSAERKSMIEALKEFIAREQAH